MNDPEQPISTTPADAAPPTLNIEWAFFLDIDGTLADLAPSPDIVRLDDDLRRLVDRLRRRVGGAVAIISGRSLVDIDRLFPDVHFPAAGQHGIERRAADGVISRHANPAGPLTQARILLSEAVTRYPGLRLEDKGLSLALHYRDAPELAGVVRSLLHSAEAAMGAEYGLQEGKYLLELKPSGRDKGTAVLEFMREHPFRSRTPVFIGDDVTDEYGFAIVNQLDGHSIKVGPGPTAAHWRLHDVAAVQRWLARGLEERS